jgi:regulator of nucleoside diphosphate kinase
MADQTELFITRADLERLQRLIEQNGSGPRAHLADMLEGELSRAQVCDDVPRNVVTMNSAVVFEDEETGARREVTLCYPHEVRGEAGRVSVLAPVGSALIGLSVGQSIEWPVPKGRRRLRIVSVALPGRAA